MSNIFNRKRKGKLDPGLPPERRVVGMEQVVLQPGAALCWGGHKEPPMVYRGSPQPQEAKPINEGDPNNFLSKAHKLFNVSNLRKSEQVVFDSL